MNLLSSGIHLQSQELGYYLNTGKMPKRPKNHSGHIWQEAPYGIFKTRNGYMSLATNVMEKIPRFAELIGVPNLPELMPDKPTALRDRDELIAVIAPAMEKQTTEYWLEKFQAEGFWCAKVNNYEDVANDPQVQHNNIIQTVEHPVAGAIKVIAAPIEFSETPVSIRRAPPTLGQHTDEILGELGYSPEEIGSMREENVV